MLLSLALASFAAWRGIAVSLAKDLPRRGRPRAPPGRGARLRACCSPSWASRRSRAGRKAHFEDVYVNAGLLLAFGGLLSGVFGEREDWLGRMASRAPPRLRRRRVRRVSHEAHAAVRARGRRGVAGPPKAGFRRRRGGAGRRPPGFGHDGRRRADPHRHRRTGRCEFDERGMDPRRARRGGPGRGRGLEEGRRGRGGHFRGDLRAVSRAARPAVAALAGARVRLRLPGAPAAPGSGRRRSSPGAWEPHGSSLPFRGRVPRRDGSAGERAAPRPSRGRRRDVLLGNRLPSGRPLPVPRGDAEGAREERRDDPRPRLARPLGARRVALGQPRVRRLRRDLALSPSGARARGPPALDRRRRGADARLRALPRPSVVVAFPSQVRGRPRRRRPPGRVCRGEPVLARPPARRKARKRRARRSPARASANGSRRWS